MKKKIYFVRHGETLANVQNIRQGPESELNETGKEQARILAERFKTIPVDVIVASPFVRTKQTAQSIHDAIGAPVEFSEYFVERKNPTEILGLKSDDEKAEDVTKKIFENYHTPGWRYSDEENFEDLKDRAGKAMRYLEERPEENILVVSHGLFMRTFLARMMFGESLTSQEFVATVYSHWVRNTGITLYEYDPDRSFMDNRSWIIKIWNDHAHLG